MSTPDPRRTPQGPRHTLCLRAALTPTSRRGSCALRPLPGASCAAMPPTRAPTRRGSPGCASAARGPVLGREVRHRREQRVRSGLVDGPRQDARRESRPPRNSPLSPEPSTAPRTEFQPLPSALLPAGGGRSPSGHRAGRGCDGAAARAARGSAVSGRESRLPCHPPVAAPFTQDPAVAPAQVRAVCRRENPSWTSVQLERCGPRVRACVCVRTPVDACALVCMCACVHACTCARVCTCRTPPPGRWPPLALPAPAGPSPWGPGGGRPAAWTGLAGAAAPPPSASRGCAVSAGEEDGRDQSTLETKVWEAHNPLIDKQIDQFLVVAR